MKRHNRLFGETGRKLRGELFLIGENQVSLDREKAQQKGKKKGASLSGRQSTYIQQVTTSRGRSRGRTGQVADHSQRPTRRQGAQLRIEFSVRYPIVDCLSFISYGQELLLFYRGPASCQSAGRPVGHHSRPAVVRSIIGQKIMFGRCFASDLPVVQVDVDFPFDQIRYQATSVSFFLIPN